MMKRSLSMQGQRTGEENVFHLRDQLQLGDLLLTANRIDEAEELLRPMQRTIARVASDDLVLRSQASLLFGRVLVASGSYLEAEKTLLQTLALERELSPPEADSPVLETLIDLYEAWGRPDEAARYREIRASLPEPVGS